MTADHITPDSEHRGLVGRLPAPLRDYVLLARFDRPIGCWLLFWPCVWGVWLTGAGAQWQLLAWLLLGAIAMRGAGCVYNDIVDADLDRPLDVLLALDPYGPSSLGQPTAIFRGARTAAAG